MPIKRNAIKALRQAKKRAAKNLIRKTAVKKTVKGALQALAAGEKDIKAMISAAQQALDKAAKVGVIKKKTASRRLSRLMKKVSAAAKK